MCQFLSLNCVLVLILFSVHSFIFVTDVFVLLVEIIRLLQ